MKSLVGKVGVLRNVGILAGGTAAAQGILALSMPVLTRVYSPEDFNLLAVYASILGLIAVGACLRFNIAIPLPESHQDGMALLLLSLISSALFACLTVIPVAFAPQATAVLLGQPAFQSYLWFIPAGVLLTSSYDALQYWASRRRRFGLIARTRLTKAAGGAGSQLVIGSVAPSPFGLIIGHLIYSGLGIAGLLRSIWCYDRSFFANASIGRLVEVARTYRKFPLFSVPEALFNTIGIEVSVLIIAASAIGPEAGFLMLAMRVMGLPMALIGSSVGQVYIVEAPEKLRAGELPAFTRRIMSVLLKTGGTVLLLVGLASPVLFPIVFGPDWARAGVIVLLLTPMIIIQFVASPVSMALHVIGKLTWAMALQIVGAVIRVSCVALAAHVSPSYITEAFALSSALFYLVYLLAIYIIIARKSAS